MKPEDVFAELGKALAGKLVKDSVITLTEMCKVYLNAVSKG